MRIVHVDTAEEWRGGQQQLAYLLRARPQDRWAGVPGSALAAVAGPPHVALRPGGDPRNALALLGVEADLFAAHTPHAHGLCLLAGKRTVVHRRVDFTPRDPWKYRRVAGVIAVSRAVAGVMTRAGVDPDRVRVVYDGVEPAEDGPGVGELPRPVYGCAGALVDHKGHRWAVDALFALRGSLVIVGEGPNRGALLARARERGVEARVHLPGQLPELGGFFASIDALVHPSVEEGFGQVVVEAMLAGCPVVTTTAGGLPEVVGDAGVLVPPRDADALAAGMLAVLSRPRGEAVAWARRFSVDRMVTETEAAYRAFLGDGP